MTADIVRPSVISANSKAEDSQLSITNLPGATRRVTAVGISSVTITDETGTLEGVSLYSASTPGALVITEGIAAGDKGKYAEITAVAAISSGTRVLTVDTDLTSALAADDTVMVIPPLAAKVLTRGGHTLSLTRRFDEEMGLTEAFDTHNSPLGHEVGGDIPFFLANDAEYVSRLILAGTGAYIKSGTGQHDFYPVKSGFAGTANAEYLTAYSKDGNGVLNQVFLSMFGTRLTLTVPENGVATGALSLMGGEYLKEVGGSGKAFASGTNNWDNATGAAAGTRHSYRGALVELGGSFGDALTNAADPYFMSAEVVIEKTGADNTPLGSDVRMRPVEEMHRITVTGRRVLENDTLSDNHIGSGDAWPAAPTETRLLLSCRNPRDITKKLDVDIPRGIFTAAPVVRQRGRFQQDFTYRGLHTLSSGAPAAATPLYRVRHVSGVDSDLIAAL